ncbi:hypothetical protein HDU96_000238, partial [Phlyctochytrium bullatum]
MSSSTSRYVRYKNATEGFIRWLRSTLPKVSKSVNMTAMRIREAAEAVRAAGKAVPLNVMRSLETAIELREEVMSKYKSDEGHGYFLKLLKDVRRLLLPLTKSDAGPTTGMPKKAAKKEETLVNQFSVLSVDIDETGPISCDTEEAAEREEPDPVQREEKKSNIDIDVDTQWFVIRCFMYEASELVQEVIDSWSDYKKGTVPIFVPTTATTLALQLLTKLVSKLQLDYPHLLSWDHIVTALAFDDLLQSIVSTCPRITYGTACSVVTGARVFPLPHMIVFVLSLLILDGMPKAQVEYLSYKIITREQLVRTNPAYFDWFGNFVSISQTQRLLKSFLLADLTRDQRDVPQWDERSNPALNFSDLYREFAYTMLRVLASTHETRWYDLPYKDPHKVIPLIDQIAVFMDEKRISMELVFALHLVLWATFVCQGNMTCTKLAISASIKISDLKARVDANSKFGLLEPEPSRKEEHRSLKTLQT